MTEASEAFRAYDRDLLDALQEGLSGLEVQTDDGTLHLSGRLETLADRFVRYVEASEASLYPAVAPLVAADDEVMSPMRFDVRMIEDYTAEGEELAAEAETSTDEGRRERARRVARMAAAYEALIRAHIAKLEVIYLPYLERLAPEQRAEVLDAMTVQYGPPPERVGDHASA
jgi:hemerythrin-like domain-containing protein